MADLPDIDTSTVGFIAYWNALDHGVNDIDPSEVTSDSDIVSYTIYDNGLEGTYRPSYMDASRDFTFRVKEDGWFITYLDRRNEFGQSTTKADVEGYWDLPHDATDEYSPSDIQQNTLERAIYNLHRELSNSGSITYSNADVGLYNYEFSTSTTVTLFSYADSNSSTNNLGITYTSDTTRNWHVAWGSGRTARTASWEGTTVLDSNNSYGALDILANALMPNSGTEYTGRTEQDCQLGHLILWE
jgi:hypothetical protein